MNPSEMDSNTTNRDATSGGSPNHDAGNRRPAPILLRETWMLALQALAANKVRAMLTMLGVIIGSACIVLVVTVAMTGKRYVIAQIEGVGSNLIYGWLIPSPAESPADEIAVADLQAIQDGVPQVVATAGTNDQPMTVTVNGAEHPIHVIGVTEGFEQIRRLQITNGRYFDEDDMRSKSKMCLLNEPLAAFLFPHEDPVGKEIHVADLYFTVIGIFRERISTFGQSEIVDRSLIVPFSLIKEYTGTDYIKTFYAQADKPEDVLRVKAGVVEVLRSRHRLSAKYNVETLTSILEAAKSISEALTVLLILVAIIALTISGVGIMNIMLITVTERTHEIGIRKAIGAPSGAILYQFLMEAFLISGGGALLGILAAVSIVALANFAISVYPEAGSIRVPISWLSVVLASVLSCSTGLLFGYLPANQAAKLHPTESLRHE
jgi:putative ABC transport system permease protein